MHKGIRIAVAVGLASLVGTGLAKAADKLKIGVTATLEGTYTVLGEDGMRGYELALKAHSNKAAGREIETIVGSTDASPDSALRALGAFCVTNVTPLNVRTCRLSRSVVKTAALTLSERSSHFDLMPASIDVAFSGLMSMWSGSSGEVSNTPDLKPFAHDAKVVTSSDQL